MSPLAARAGSEGRLGRGSGTGGEFVTDVGELPFHLGELQPEQGGAGGEHEVEAGGHEGLVAAVDFAEAALGAVAVDGIADGGPGGDDPHAGGRGGGFGGAHPPGQEEGPAVHAAALLTNGAKIIVAPQALPGAQAHLRRP